MTIGREPDVLMGDDGDLPAFCRLASGRLVTAQRIGCRFETHFGDWPLDKAAGIRWTELLGQKPRDPSRIAAILAAEARQVPGVVAVEDLAWAVGADVLELAVSMTIRTVDGDRVPLVIRPVGVAGNVSIVVGGLMTHHLGVVR